MINRSSASPASMILAVGLTFTWLASLALTKQSDQQVYDLAIQSGPILDRSVNPHRQVFQPSLSVTISSEKTRGQTP